MKQIYRGNKGMATENRVELTCRQLKERNLAIIKKVPIPITILKKDRNIIKGRLDGKATVDFEGTIKGGRSIAFDSKETKSKTSLPLENIHQHQIDYLESVDSMGGIAFILVCFTSLDKYYRLDIKDLLGYIKAPYKTNLKSIPLNYFENYSKEVKSRNGLYLDFLEGV